MFNSFSLKQNLSRERRNVNSFSLKQNLNDFDIVSTFQHSNKISINNRRPHTSSDTKPIGNPEITSLDTFLGEKYYKNINTIGFD